MVGFNQPVNIFLQGFESYNRRDLSLRRMLQIGRGMLLACCGSLQSYRGVLQSTRGILQAYCGAVVELVNAYFRTILLIHKFIVDMTNRKMAICKTLFTSYLL